MVLVEAFFRRIQRSVFRAIPDASGNDPLDATFAARSTENRWNRFGEPTLYVAGDSRVMAAEWARHVDELRLTPGIVQAALPRRIFELRIDLDAVLDLRDPALCSLLGVADTPVAFLRDKGLCQSLSGRLRRETPAQAVIAPSMALLDQPERWVMVLFADKLPGYPGAFISVVRSGITLP